MGYDMSMKQGPTVIENEALEAVQQKIDAALAERSKHERGTPEANAAQIEVERLFEEKYELPSEYYRLNIWCMGHCREYMAERGMTYSTRMPEFPDFGEYPEQEDFETPEKYEAAAFEWDEKYEKLCAPILEHHPEGGDTIPDHKFGSNDGWHVTEAECAAAAAAAKATELPAPTRVEDGLEVAVQWWDSWVDFLDRASTRGGFTVH